MTADEIKETDESCKTEKGWFKEIAYQLATLNEAKPLPLQVGQKKTK